MEYLPGSGISRHEVENLRSNLELSTQLSQLEDRALSLPGTDTSLESMAATARTLAVSGQLVDQQKLLEELPKVFALLEANPPQEKVNEARRIVEGYIPDHFL